MSITKNHEEKIDYLILIGISRGNGKLGNIIVIRHAENGGRPARSPIDSAEIGGLLQTLSIQQVRLCLFTFS